MKFLLVSIFTMLSAVSFATPPSPGPTPKPAHLPTTARIVNHVPQVTPVVKHIPPAPPPPNKSAWVKICADTNVQRAKIHLPLINCPSP